MLVQSQFQIDFLFMAGIQKSAMVRVSSCPCATSECSGGRLEWYWVESITKLLHKLGWPKMSTENKNLSSFFTQFYYL